MGPVKSMEYEPRAAAATAIVLAGAAYAIYKKITANNQTNNSGFVKIGTVAAINFYPLKSGRKVSLHSAKLTNVGLASDDLKLYDRSFMVYNPAKNTVLSGKQMPRLVRLGVRRIGPDEIELDFGDGHPGLTLPSAPQDLSQLYRNIKICGKIADALDCGDEAADWITETLFRSRDLSSTKTKDHRKVHYRIVYFDQKVCQKNIQEVMANRLEKIGQVLPESLDYNTTLSDTASYSIHSLQSERFVANSIKQDGFEKLDNDCWRGNLLIDNLDNRPFSEDQYERIYIGRRNQNYTLTKFSKCSRCFLTTVEPSTGEARKDSQPLKWLNQHRAIPDEESEAYPGWGVKSCLGNYYAVGVENSATTCEVKVGDPVYGYASRVEKPESHGNFDGFFSSLVTKILHR